METACTLQTDYSRMAISTRLIGEHGRFFYLLISLSVSSKRKEKTIGKMEENIDIVEKEVHHQDQRMNFQF